MSKISNNQPSHIDPTKFSNNAHKQQSPHIGAELGKDMVNISKEFAKGTSSGSAGALSKAKEAAKADKDQRRTEETRAANDVKRVTPTKTVSASQADSGIKSQVEKQNSHRKNTDHLSINNKTQSPPQAAKACPFCKGTGCSVCQPMLIETKTQTNKAEKASELDDQKKRINKIRRIKYLLIKTLSIFKPKKIIVDPKVDKLNRIKKRNINT